MTHKRPWADDICGELVDRKLFGLDACKLDDRRPLIGFVGDELAKVGGRASDHRAAEVGEPRFNFGSARPALISLLSFSMMSAGVFLGAPTPKNALAS